MNGKKQEMLLLKLCCLSSFMRQAFNDTYIMNSSFSGFFSIYTLISTEFAPLSLTSPTMLPSTQVSFTLA